jgi:MFS family permease
MNAYWQLVRRNPGYARLWLAAAVSLLGDWFNTIVLLALVSRFTEGSGVAISVFLLARTVPPLLIGPYAGVLADRFNRKYLMIAADLLRAAVVLGFLAATRIPTPDLWPDHRPVRLDGSLRAGPLGGGAQPGR